MKKLKRRFVIPIIVLAVIFVLFHTILFVGYVPTESMEPTIHKDSFIVGCRIFDELEIGDVVIFQNEGELLVKRVASVSGSTIKHNSQCLEVPANSLYLLGDNPDNSWDSRYWDNPFVSVDQVRAKVLFGK